MRTGYNARFGTLAGRMGGLGEALTAADQEDADQGTWMGPMNSQPYNPQGQSGWFDAIPGLVEKGIALKQSMDVAALNRDLIRQGRAPLTSAQIAALQPGVRFGLATDTQNVLMYGGIALLAVFALSSFTKRRR